MSNNTFIEEASAAAEGDDEVLSWRDVDGAVQVVSPELVIFEPANATRGAIVGQSDLNSQGT
jgi:hypothetical protein